VFIFAFLPVTLALFFLAGTHSRRLALVWLTLASLFFYAWWRPINVLIIGPSLLVNYLIARALVRVCASGTPPARARWLLAGGIVFNLSFLGYFKYVNFVAGALNDIAGTQFVLEQVILPLGISFITFQKIAFLVDVHSQRIKSFSFADYCLFVLFFPQLIAGPIVHFREMMPQFQRASCRFDKEDVAVGLTLFFMGLFKKVCLADGIAPYVTPTFESAAAGGNIPLILAWIAALGFTLQIYFDFSGYSDMALGLGRCFGVRLPPNFDSPLKASSIIEFWLRWHMTLTRFLTAYLYNPMVLWLTRRRLAKGLSTIGGRNSSGGAFVQLLMGPTLLTMLVSGLWHGAGYLFILWGLLHGVYLTINHAWRLIGPGLWSSRASYERFMLPTGFVLTFAAVVFGMVLFRATSGEAASAILKGMIGMNGISLPQQLLDRLGPLAGQLQRFVAVNTEQSLMDFALGVSWVGSLLFVALALPNTLEIMARYEPALGVKSGPGDRVGLTRLFTWGTTLPWALAVSALAAMAIIQLGGNSEFLYWQF
jgi:D-alanyl-lipoteichoic acid acyltransferase DltB (MBOAT superfamily)